MILGAHVSIAGGVAAAQQNAALCACQTFQMFTKNQLRWSAEPLTRDQVAAFRAGMQEHRLVPGTVHATYLVNLAAADPDLLAKSRTCMVSELERTERLRFPYLVVHPGAHRGQGAAAGIEVAAASLDEVFRRARAHHAMVLLETTTGVGSVLGATFEELAAIRGLCHYPTRIGYCVDTCHVYGAGYDIRLPSGYEATVAQMDRVLGLANVKAFHLNDSTGTLGSRVDRHARIGQGELGTGPFRLLVNDPRFAAHPGILEVPGETEAYAEDLALLRSLHL